MDKTVLTKGLNDQQKQAVTMPPDRPVLVLAGAGCGKTAVLTRRIAYLAGTHFPQDRILAVTFTRKAAEEMGERVRGMGCLDPDAPMPAMTTFHGFGLGVLRGKINGVPNHAALGYANEPALLAEQRRIALLAEVSSPEQRKLLGTDILKLDALLERCKVHPQGGDGLGEIQKSVLDEIRERLGDAKRRENVWEFSDMIGGLLDVFVRRPDIAKEYALKYRAVLVDEFQDTNPLQIHLLKILLGQGAHLFAVGDDDQAIYGFRGADIGPIRDFRSHFDNATLVKLQTNYRSTPSILSAANRIFHDKPPEYRKVLRSGRFADDAQGRGPRPVKVRFRDQTSMVGWIIRKAEELVRTEGISLEKTALLFRTNQSLEWARTCVESMRGGGEGGPQFFTVHGSKGLEFPAVFLCDLEESAFPNYRQTGRPKVRSWGDLLKAILKRNRSSAEDCDIGEERRLFYVGVTRAERVLFLVSVKEKQHFGRVKRLEPSRFLKLI